MDDSFIIQALSPLDMFRSGGSRIEIHEGLPPQVSNSFAPPEFERAYATSGYGSMSFQHYSGESFDIWYSHYDIRENSTFIARGNLPALELHIPLNRQCISWWDNQREIRPLDKQYQLSYIPFIDFRSEFKGGFRYSSFDIHYSADYLKRFASCSPQLAVFLEKVDQLRPAELIPGVQILSPAMMETVWHMLNCRLTGPLARLYYEHGTQLLLIQLLDRLNGQQPGLHSKYSSTDVDRARHAKMLIDCNIATRFSINQLAQLTQFNYAKLQATFKYVFGMTIYDYAQSARLDHAKNLLTDTTESIQSIAMQCGYPEHSNLSAAFRKRYGYPPEFFRKQCKKYRNS